MIYLGAESGDDEVLVHIQKGETAAEIIAASPKLNRCGIQTSVTLISGLGGSAGMEAHAVKSAELINAMNPEYASILHPAPLSGVSHGEGDSAGRDGALKAGSDYG